MTHARTALAALALAAASAGCNAISGLGDLHVVDGAGTTTAGAGGGDTTTGAGGGATTTTTGAGGAGGATTGACSSDAQCPGPADGCSTPRCKAGACGAEPTAQGTPAKDDVAGDCQRRVCDGAGNAASVTDDTDVPPSDGPCWLVGCNAGVAVHDPRGAGTPCGANGEGACDGKGQCVECLTGPECPSGVCLNGACQAPGCGDGVQNGEETGVDCGGGCPGCAAGAPCGDGPDCASLVCTSGTCAEASCGDKVKNGAETDADCGGGVCPTCAFQQACAKHADCASEICLGGACAKVTQLVAGSAHACALLSDGSVHCWGANAAGQLGDGTTAPHASPTRVQLVAKATAVAVGNHQPGDPALGTSCARLDDGTVACWGANDAGQLGRGAMSPHEATPAVVKGLADVTSIAVGGRHACAVSNKDVLCWGDAERGQLGTGSHKSSATPAVTSASKFGPAQAVFAGSEHTCALFQLGLACTGANGSGQLGTGDQNDRVSFDGSVGLFGGGAALGGTFSLGWGGFGGSNVQAWGDNTTGQLGTGQSPGAHPNANTVKQLSGVVQVAAGTRVNSELGGHSCAAHASGGASCWGDNSHGQLGDGTTNGPYGQPHAVPSLKGVTEVAAGGSFTCARLGDGPLRCWGKNDIGQLGRGVASNQPGLTPGAVVWP